MMSSVRVAVRVRPLNDREINLNSHVVVAMRDKVVRITNPKTQDPASASTTMTDGSLMSRSSHGSDAHSALSPGSSAGDAKEFPFHFCFWSCDKDDPHFVGQEVVYKHMGEDVVKAAYGGYNACVFAYGQTGSGKTYSMMGTEGDPGIIPRICKSLFDGMVSSDAVTYRTEVSYLEIYNERVHDLLKSDSRSSRSSTSGSTSLRVREHPKDGPYVQGLSRHIANNCSDVLELMEKGNHLRTTASTNMNDTSSRSHAIFTILFTQANFSKEQPEEKYSKIHLVDLAGSERACATGATGHRLKEGGNINKSLVLLGNVISTLAEKSTNRKVTFVPYRDSVLTWLLKDSLGGNSKTMMIATISPAACNYSETLSTLRYASRAKCIINRPEVNEDPNVKVIRELREEIQRLRSRLESQSHTNGGNGAESVMERLQASEARVAILTQAWTGRWNEMVSVLGETSELDLRRHESGVSGVVLDSKLPYLVAINTDELSTGISLFHLKEGSTKVGSDKATQDIVLSGDAVLAHHCSIETADPKEPEESAESTLTRSINSNKSDGSEGRLLYTVTLRPVEDALCSINGVKVEEPVKLIHGCILQVGSRDMFRFNNPAEARKMRREGAPKQGLSLSFRNSLWLNRSLEELNKSDVSFQPSDTDLDSGISGKSSGMNSESCSEEKLVEKRRELAELEDRLYEAETRWRREAQEKEAELDAKRKRLEELQGHLEESRSRVTSETKKSRRVSIDMERYRSCHSPAELFAQMQSDLDEKYNRILDSEMERLNAESKELDEQKARQEQELEKDEALMKAAMNKKQLERDSAAAEVSRLKEDVHTLRQMLERGELSRDDYNEYSNAVSAELQEQVAHLELCNSELDRQTVLNQAGLQSLTERRRIAAQDAADARRDLEIREAALRRDLSLRMNEELATLVEDLVRSSGRADSSPTVVNGAARDDLYVGVDSQTADSSAKGKLGATENEVMALTQQVRAAEESLRAEERFLEDKEEQVEMKRWRLHELEESHRLSREVEEEVRRRMAEEARQREAREEREREEARQREMERLRQQHAMTSLPPPRVLPTPARRREMAELRRRLEPQTVQRGFPRSASTSSDDSFLPPASAASFRSLTSLRTARSMMNLPSGPPSDLGGDARARTIEVCVTGYLMRSSFVEYEIKVEVGTEAWTVCRRYSIIREFHDELRRTYPEIRSIEFPPRTMFWDSVERVAQSRVVLLQKYFRHLIRYLQKHPYCNLNPTKSRVPLCRRVVCQVLPILRKGEFDNSRFTTA